MNVRTTISAALLGTATLAAGSATAGLVAHWDFDSDLTDTNGAYDGTAVGDAAIDNGNSQIGGGSATFDGTGDGITTGDIDLTGDGYTISAWVYMPAAQDGADFIAGKTNSYQLGIRNTNNLWIGANTANVWTATGNNGAAAATNAWVHVAAVYDGTELLRYINGVEDLSDTDPAKTGNLTPNNEAFTIGYSFSQGRHFAGNIDDVAVFDEGLSASDILAIYNGGLAGQNAAQVIPEPSSLGLLGLGGLLMLRRRRG